MSEIWEIEEDYELINGYNQRVYRIKVSTKDGLVFKITIPEGFSAEELLQRIADFEAKFKPFKQKRGGGGQR